MRLGLLLGIAFSFCLCAAPRTETGSINGAAFRIDVPDHWNGGLVMYCHGYAPVPVTYDKPDIPPQLAVILDAGYAVAQSGYAAGGWAIQEALVDTEELRRYFVKKYGPVKETYVTGHSMGGFLTMALMETYSSVYDAGLPLCGPLAAPAWFISHNAFDGRVLFDYNFPGVLSDPSHVDADWSGTKELAKKIEDLLDANPAKSAALRQYNGIKNNQDLAGGIVFATDVLKELQQRAGGNPFDNRYTIYTGMTDDPAVNAGVKRYAAVPAAANALRNFYTPTGRISKPMLAVHTVYDPIVPAWVPNTYQLLAEQAGASQWFVQQYVAHDGHCTITAPEIAKAFSELREWKSSGVRPPGGELKVPGQPAVNAGSR
jgi:pimeloyl-ACP methyl ester carboxylesterase